ALLPAAERNDVEVVSGEERKVVGEYVAGGGRNVDRFADHHGLARRRRGRTPCRPSGRRGGGAPRGRRDAGSVVLLHLPSARRARERAGDDPSLLVVHAVSCARRRRNTSMPTAATMIVPTMISCT